MNSRLLPLMCSFALCLGCEPEIIVDMSVPPASQPAQAGAASEAKVIADPVTPPWTPAEIKASVKLGRSWVLQEHVTYYAGPDKKETLKRIEAEVVELGDDHYKVKRKLLDEKGKVVSEGDPKKAHYEDVNHGVYSQLSKSETKISAGEIECAGRKWKAKIYRNRQIVDYQEHIVTIWNSVEQPGLALKLLVQTPRMTREVVLVKFNEGS